MARRNPAYRQKLGAKVARKTGRKRRRHRSGGAHRVGSSKPIVIKVYSVRKVE